MQTEPDRSTNVLVVDHGDSNGLSSIADHLFLFLLQFNSEVFSARDASEIRETFQVYGSERQKDGLRIDKAIVIGREGGMELEAERLINEIQAQPGSVGLPIALVTKTSAAAEAGLRAKLRGKAEVIAVPKETIFDAVTDHTASQAGANAFYNLVGKTLADWIRQPPTKGRGGLAQ